jgi:hypothetical protein
VLFHDSGGENGGSKLGLGLGLGLGFLILIASIVLIGFWNVRKKAARKEKNLYRLESL